MTDIQEQIATKAKELNILLIEAAKAGYSVDIDKIFVQDDGIATLGIQVSLSEPVSFSVSFNPNTE